MSQYCSISDIENYLLIEVDPSFESQVSDWIEVMSKYIEEKTGRIFIADDEATDKLYDGDSSNLVIIDDAISVNSVSIKEGDSWRELDSDEYFIYPANRIPKTFIVANGWKFPKGYQNIKVNAKWGYAKEIPEDIKFACAVLVSGIINNSLSHEGEIQSVNIGAYSVSYKNQKQWQDFDQIDKILENYKRYF